jgi:hypothetical protein
MRRKVTVTLLLISLASSVWIEIDPSARLHNAFTHYDPKDIFIQALFAIGCAVISFAAGSLFRK